MVTELIELSSMRHRYNENFVLDEQSLRRIQETLCKSTENLNGDFYIEFGISREDRRSITTNSIDRIFSDANVFGKRVNGLAISFHDSKSIHPELLWFSQYGVYITFEKERTQKGMIEVAINTNDTNWGWKLADELDSELRRTFKSKGTPYL